MNAERFFFRYGKRVSDEIDSAADLESRRAARLPSPLKGESRKFDTPVTVFPGRRGEPERWNSRFLCYHYYHIGAIACGGTSEGERYQNAADSVLSTPLEA